MTSTGTDGKVYTITQYTKPATTGVAGSASTHGSSSFFDNTGAVAGTFVAVGIVVTTGVAAFIFFMLRRRRRQRLDRDVATAAAAAAAAHQPRFEDDDEPNLQYAAYYQSQSSHDFEGQEPEKMGRYEYEDPAGGYDRYADNLVDAPPADRASTFTQAGMAGFGATAASAGYNSAHPADAYGGYNDQQQYGSHAPDFSHSYGDPQYDVAHQYAAPDMGGLSTVPEMSAEGHSDNAHYYNHQVSQAFGMTPPQPTTNNNGYSYADDPYGGYEMQPPQSSHGGHALERLDSNGSVQPPGGRRDLTVSNV